MARLPELLPEDGKKFNSAQDGLAALLHTAMVQHGFHLVEANEDSSDLKLKDVLPKDWAQKGPDSYTFKYKQDKSSSGFALNMSRFENCLFVQVFGLEARHLSPPPLWQSSDHNTNIQGNEIPSLRILTDDLFSSSFTFPYVVGTEPLTDGFISSNKITVFMSDFASKIVSKILPAPPKYSPTDPNELPHDLPVTSSEGQRPAPLELLDEALRMFSPTGIAFNGTGFHEDWSGRGYPFSRGHGQFPGGHGQFPGGHGQFPGGHGSHHGGFGHPVSSSFTREYLFKS